MNRNFSKEDMETANKHVKQHSASLVIRLTIITTMRNHYFTPIRAAATRSGGNCSQGCKETGIFVCYYVNVIVNMKNDFSVFQNIKHSITLWYRNIPKGNTKKLYTYTWTAPGHKKNQVLIHATIHMNFKNAILCKKQAQRSHIVWFHSYKMSKQSNS